MFGESFFETLLYQPGGEPHRCMGGQGHCQRKQEMCDLILIGCQFVFMDWCMAAHARVVYKRKLAFGVGGIEKVCQI